MSDKKSLKDRIRKPTPAQEFINSYKNIEDNDNLENESENKNAINNGLDDNIINKDNINNENNVKTYVNDNNVINVNSNNEDDEYLRNLAIGNKAKKKRQKKVFTSFYMDPDLAAEVDKIASRGEKGDKSKLINRAIRKLLEDYGVIASK